MTDTNSLEGTPAGVLTTLEPDILLDRSQPLTLEPDTVHVWAFSLEGDTETVARCRSSLSPQERQRADRFVFERDRIRHTVAHGVLRHLLSRYCGVQPGSLSFAVSAAGKPALAPPHTKLRFNLTHAEDRALLGVSCGRELGIDLEQVRSDIEALAISGHYFYGTERQAIETAPAAACASTFFRYWVAKEAVLKAQGIGLGFPLDRFRVDFLPGGWEARIESLDPATLAADWHIRMLPCATGWLGAIASRGTDWVWRQPH